MKKQIFICSLFLLGMACSDYEDLATPEQSLRIENETTEQTIALENVVFDEATGQWLYLAGDPYKLENVKQAYNRIISGESRFETTRSQIDELIEIGEPEITHYSLKFYPRTEAEQWRIMRIDGLQYSFYPFEYMPLTDEQVQTLSLTRSSTQTLPFESRYSVTYTDLMTPDGPADPQTVHLPTIYATWPVENSLPLDLEFEIVEELYLPEYTGSESDSSVALLESEVLPVTPLWEVNPITPIQPINRVKFKGRVLHYDDVLERNVPISGLSVFLRYGSNSVSGETDEDGYFVIYDSITSIATATLYLSTSQYWITPLLVEGETETNSATYTTVIGSASDFLYDTTIGIPLVNAVTVSNDTPYFETVRAASYYFFGDHEIQTAEQPDGLRISVSSGRSLKNYAGAFYPRFIQNKSHIEIFNLTSYYSDAQMIGTTLHELGHFTHYYERDAVYTDNWENILKFIIESFASYVGNYLAYSYYEENGLTLAADYLYQARQEWVGGTNYSPIFVDLFDTYNQHTDENSPYPDDDLSGFSHDVMRQIAQEIDTFAELETLLESYMGIYYTTEDFNKYMAYYSGMGL